MLFRSVRQVADPRLTAITITDVKVDRELAYADIFVSSWEGSEHSELILTALRHAGGFLRTELAALVDLRAMPRLRFHWDPTPENADHIEKILLQLRNESTQQTAEQQADLPPVEEDDTDDDVDATDDHEDADGDKDADGDE